MTKLEKLLTEIIQKVVCNELQQFKVQLLREIAQPTVNGKELATTLKRRPIDSLVEMQTNFRKNLVQPQRQKVQYSKDPLLNSILAECEPINEQMNIAQRFGYVDEETPIVVTSGLDGSTINPHNKGVQNVLEAMNRDYSGMFKSQPNAEVKSKIYNMIADEPDEDLGWLSKVS